jgi:ABC-2 type transport system permease protein
MSFTRMFAVYLRQLFLIKSNPTRLASIFVWLLVDILLWGFISRYLGTLGQSTFGFVTVILGAIILWEFLTRIQHGIMTSFLEDIWSQNFINFFSSPLTIVEYLSGMMLNSFMTGIGAFILGVGLAGVAFGYNMFTIGLMLIPFMAVLFVFGIAMGIIVSSMIFRLGPSAEWLGWPIPMVISVFAGVYYPVATLPVPMQMIAKAVPPSYVFESVRAVIAGSGFSGEIALNLLLGGGISCLYLALAYYVFVRVYRRNLRTGAIARFSAESL